VMPYRDMRQQSQRGFCINANFRIDALYLNVSPECQIGINLSRQEPFPSVTRDIVCR
jgi:hypothetical protein